MILQHGGKITTLYAHMNSYVLKVGVGTRVKHEQTIGFVGMTGLATANHLYYEYRLEGVHCNPRTVSLPDAVPINAQYREQFQSTQTPTVAYNSQHHQ